MWKIKLRNKRTGAVVAVDTRKLRFQRLRRRVSAWIRAVDRLANTKLVMVTLTYADVDGWQPGHISSFISHVRRHMGKRLYGYAWVAELQKRGAPHYHVLLFLRGGASVPFPDKMGWWTHGSTQTERARTPYYICKYLQKGVIEASKYPLGMRIFAVALYKHAPSTQFGRLLLMAANYPAQVKEALIKHGLTRAFKFAPGLWAVTNDGRTDYVVVDTGWAMGGLALDDFPTLQERVPIWGGAHL